MNMRKSAKYAAIPVGLLVSGLIVAQSSSAAFTATTTTGANSWTTGSIDLTNDHVSTAVFTETGLVPGSHGSKDVVVTYTGNVASDIVMYTTTGTGTDALAQAITITVKDGATTIYDGTLAAFAALDTFAEGVGAWQQAANGSKTYTIDWSVSDAAPEGATTNAVFAWEAQSVTPAP